MESTSIYMGEKLLEIEAESGLFDLIVEGVHLWQYVRLHCLLKILEEITGFRMSNQSRKTVECKAEKNFAIGEWIKKRQFWVCRKDLLVINHPRRVREGACYKCFVTDTLLEKLDYSYYVYEKEYMGMHFKPVKTKHLKYITIKSKEKDDQKCDKLLKEFAIKVIKVFEEECEFKLSKALRDHIAIFVRSTFYNILDYRIWADRVLTLVNPKAVMVTVGYDQCVQVIIAEAKKRRIPTIELEHGRIGNTHLAYNYIYQGEIETFADYMFTYGEYEKVVPRYPIDQKNVIAVGYPELERKALLYANKKRKRKQKVLTFISGFLDGKIVSKYAVDLRKSRELKNIRMIYKLHPVEYDQWKQLYPNLLNSGLEIISDNLHDVYYYIGNSDYVVGISSTVLFETTMFSARIFVIAAGDYRKAEALYQYNMAELVTSERELEEKIVQTSLEICQQNNEVYFKNDSIHNIKKELKKILSY